MQDLEDMLGFRPYKIYFYLWKYVSPLCLIVLISATVIEMAISPPGYNAWVQELVSVWARLCESHKMYGMKLISSVRRRRNASRATLPGRWPCASP